jgi:hypothetical protein
MRTPRAVGTMLLLFAAAAMTSQAAGDKEKKKDGKKDDVKLVAGKVESVDRKKSSFTILSGGKEHTFGVTDATKFIGPKGGKADGLKDDRMALGYLVEVVPSADGKTALEVRLPLRMTVGTIKSVDKNAFTLTLESGKDHAFGVTEGTLFIGPKGGKGDGLKDDRMAKGYEVRVLAGPDGKTALEVYLPLRKKEKS